MLSVSSVDYQVPEIVYQEKEFIGWAMVGRGKRDSEELFLPASKPFNYTLIVHDHESNVDEKFTFTYTGQSVKPVMRTLRRFSADYLGPLVKTLAFNKDGISVEEASEIGSAIVAKRAEWFAKSNRNPFGKSNRVFEEMWRREHPGDIPE